ncbi:HAMP domain-containing sensor histidine kinase [Roseovarius aestuarii]|nr:HAMP domain-containing sensor histidine kinase [Roseovarius aestuarii]
MLNAQLTDYARAGVGLIVQRWAIYTAALLLEAFYYSVLVAVITAMALILSEVFDTLTYRRILRMKQRSIKDSQLCLKLLLFATLISAIIISGFALSIALLQGHTTHFMSLFFLFAAGLFATMNNHQLKSILHLRLSIYFVTFLFIPLYDIAVTKAPLSSELWAQFFTSVFVMFFITECSRISSSLYEKTLEQMEDIKREHEKTKLAYTAKSEFLSTVSHELRTPLTSIKGSLDLIEYGAFGEIPEKMTSALSIAQRNVGRLGALINDLLDLQKIEAGRMTFNFETTQVASFIEQSVSSNQPFADNLGVTLVLEPCPAHLRVQIDEARMNQVLSNILSNAAKFSESGQTVTIRAEDRGQFARISVIDCGVGLDEEDRQTVFEEFSQLDSSDRRKIGGTGLGMNISKRIVDAHSGDLDYFRNEGPGTTFYVDLPVHEDA